MQKDALHKAMFEIHQGQPEGNETTGGGTYSTGN